MGKFFLGLLAGIVVAIIALFVIVYAAVRFQSRPPVIANNSVLVLRVGGDLPEKPPVDLPALFGGDDSSVTMPNTWMALKKAASDSRIKAVVLEPEGISAGWAKIEELRMDIEAFRKSGKPVFAYLRTPAARDYYVALAADRIYMGPQEPLMLKGLRSEMMYFKGTLDKLGAAIEVEHAGKYKDFGDMFTRPDMSPETREVVNSVLDDLYGNLVARIAEARRKTPEDVRATIDRGPFTAPQALKAGLVDELRFEDQMWGELQGKLGVEPKKVSLATYSRVPAASAGLKGKSRVALVVGAGEIVRGSPGNDGIGEPVLTSYGFNALLNRVANDSGIKGVIVRIDSPGGEVTASDEILRQMSLLSKKKPTVISMSDAAASGGYYMAMTGDPIVAYPGTYTGSIGVVFGKANLRGLYQKLGITKDSEQRGAQAGIDSDYTSFSPGERRILRDGIDESYRDFVSKVAAARRRQFNDVEPLAQGRVWLGSQALGHGLVDELGGLDAAVRLLKKKANIPEAENVAIELYPPRATWIDLLIGRSSKDSAIEARIAPLAGRLPFRAWIKGGMLGVMPYWLEVR